MTPRTSQFVDSNDQRAVPCYDNLKLDEMVKIQRFCMISPTLGPIMSFPSFSHFASLPLLFPKCLHQCHYFFCKSGAMVHWCKLKIEEVKFIVRPQVGFMQLHLTIQPFEELHYTSECSENNPN